MRTTYRFRIYYEWQGPSHSDPFATEKTQPEVYTALCNVTNEFGHRLADRDSVVTASQLTEESKEVEVSADTTDSREQVIRAMETTLKDWRLFAEILAEGSAA